MTELVTVMFEVLMTLTPSRSLAVDTVRWSSVTWLQPFIRMPKWPPRLMVMPENVRPSQTLSENALSAWPDEMLPVLRWPAPSMVPEPVKPMSVRFSPHSSASWKWLWPKSWYLSYELDSAASKPDEAALMVAPESRLRVTWLRRWIEADR